MIDYALNVASDIAKAKGVAKMQVFNSETGCYSLGTPYDQTVRVYDEKQVGFTLWELMVKDCEDCGDRRRQRTGLVYPDGSVRHAES